MTKENGKPQIRFAGFDDAWEQHKLGEFGKATCGTSIESEFSDDGIYKVISIGSYSESSIYNDQGIRAIKSDKTINRVLNKNDLTMILNDKTTSGNIIGRVLLIEESGIYVYNQRTERIEVNVDKYDPLFLYEMLNAPNIREKIIKQAQGNTQIYVNWSTISLLDYMIPSREEQVKIGEYLHSISNLITLQQRKYEKLTNVKKSMLEKMFPKNGSNVPEIRFKGFTDVWKQCKVSKMFKVTRGNVLPTTVTSEKISNEMPYPVYSSQTKANGLMGYYSDYLYEDAITWTTDGANAGTVNFREGRFYCTNVCGVLLSDKIETSKAIAEALNSVTRRYVSYVGNPKLMNNIMADIQILIPVSKEEREKISSYFSKLDRLITLHQRELNKLQNIKKACLEKMLV